jgi:fumarate reductase subunit D
MAKSTSETVLWSLFAAGGVVAAMLTPALILITGIALPFVDIGFVTFLKPPTYGGLHQLAASILGRLVLFIAVSLPLFHCANRLFHTTKDLGIHSARGLIALVCYGGAILGTGVAAWLVVTL